MIYEKKYAILEQEKNDLESRISWIESNGLECDSKWRSKYLQMSKRVKQIEMEQCEL